jgi:hypothetical protein
MGHVPAFQRAKGRHLEEHDHWKETFFQEISSDFGSQALKVEKEYYRLIGVPLYSNEDEN